MVHFVCIHNYLLKLNFLLTSYEKCFSCGNESLRCEFFEVFSLTFLFCAILCMQFYPNEIFVTYQTLLQDAVIVLYLLASLLKSFTYYHQQLSIFPNHPAFRFIRSLFSLHLLIIIWLFLSFPHIFPPQCIFAFLHSLINVFSFS